MKKSLVLLSVILSLVLLFSIAGCTNETPANNSPAESGLVVEEKSTPENVEEPKETQPQKTAKVKTVEPKAEDSLKEPEPKAEEPKAEQKEEQKNEKPKAEEPKTEEPKSEEPKVTETKEEPKAEPELITKAKAKDIVLKSAGVKAADIFDYEIELDKEGKSTVYEISFETKTKEYEYEINAKTGKIIKKEIEEKEKEITTESKVKAIETPVYASTSLSEIDAKKIALKDAKLSESEITDYKIQSSRQGMILVYEISFENGNTKYEYKLNALFGTILEAEKETIK